MKNEDFHKLTTKDVKFIIVLCIIIFIVYKLF